MTRERCTSGIAFTLSVLVLVGLLGSIALAEDVVILKNHSRFEGRIVVDSLTKVGIVTNVGMIEFPRHMVQRVVKSRSGAPGWGSSKGLFRPGAYDPKTNGAKSPTGTQVKTGTAAPKQAATGPSNPSARPGWSLLSGKSRGKSLPTFDWDAPSVWRSRSSSGIQWDLPSRTRQWKTKSSGKSVRPLPARGSKANTRSMNRRTHRRNVPVWRQNCDDVKREVRRRGST